MRDCTIKQACEKKSFCLEQKENDIFSLKCTHNYYYQIQCQIYCCNVEWCDFVVRTERELHIEHINRDKKWWQDRLPKLNNFYFGAFLPELASPRQGKGGIKEPPK